MTTKAVQFRRGTSVQHLTFTGLDGEVTVDTDKKVIRVHDGSTVGGVPLAREDLSNVSQETIAGIGIAKDDLSNIDLATLTDKGLAASDLSNVSQDSVSALGIAKDDLSNLSSEADATETVKGVVELASSEETVTGTDSVRAVTPAGVQAAISNYLSLPRNFISGLLISNASDADHDITISVGECRDTTDTMDIALPSSLTKRLDSDWESGTDCGGLPTGITLNPNDTYHLFVISNGTTVDAGFDTAIDASNLLADATGYTSYRRVGSVITDTDSNIIPFRSIEMTGGATDISYLTRIEDITEEDNSATDQATIISVPTGLQFEAHVMLTSISDTTGAYPYIYATEMNSSKEIRCGSVSAGSAYANGYLFTDTSGQLSLTWGGNSNRRNYLYTTGFRDYR